MRIEKINENQIRCILSKKDLADRQIKLSELAYGSEKARDLFRDMIEQANDEFGFEADDMPLMIEAMPLSGENIILQITKIENPEELEDGFIFPEIQGWKADDFSSQTEVFAFKSLDQIERVAYLLDGFVLVLRKTILRPFNYKFNDHTLAYQLGLIIDKRKKNKIPEYAEKAEDLVRELEISKNMIVTNFSFALIMVVLGLVIVLIALLV